MDPCKFCCSGVLHGSVQSLDQSRHLIPGHNCAIWAKSCTVRVFTRFRTNMEPCRSKSRPAFFRSQICTLSRSKIRSVPPVPCKRKVELCKFLSVQRFVRTRVNGALAVQKFVQFRRSRVNARWNLASFNFVCAKICPDPCKRGLRWSAKTIFHSLNFVFVSFNITTAAYIPAS